MYLNIKKRKEDGYWAIFCGSEYLGTVYFNGTTDLSISTDVARKLIHHKLTNKDLIDALEEEFSYQNYFSMDCTDDVDELDYYADEYEDEELIIVEQDYDTSETEIPESIYEDTGKTLSSRDVYGKTTIPHKFKEELVLPDASDFGSPNSPFKYNYGTPNLKLHKKEYQEGGTQYELIIKLKAKQLNEKNELLEQLKKLNNTDKSWTYEKKDSILESIIEDILSYKNLFLTAKTHTEYTTEDERHLFITLQKEIFALRMMIEKLEEKLDRKANLDPTKALFFEFQIK